MRGDPGQAAKFKGRRIAVSPFSIVSPLTRLPEEADMRDALFEPDDTPQTHAGAVTLSSFGTQIRSKRLVLRPLNIEDANWIGPESSKPVINRMTSRVPAQNPSTV